VARLVLLQPDARVAARLGSALEQVHEVVRRDSWSGMEHPRDLADAEGCVLDADHPDPDQALHRIRRLRAAWPDLALVGFTARNDGHGYFSLGLAGLEGLVTEEDGPVATRAAVDEAISHARGRWTERVLRDELGPLFARLVGWSVTRAGTPVTVEDLARDQGRSLWSVRQELRAAHLPMPGRALLWGRLIAAGARIDRDRRSVEETAYALGYAAASGLTRAMRDATGLTPVELPAGRGPERVVDALRTRIGRP